MPASKFNVAAIVLVLSGTLLPLGASAQERRTWNVVPRGGKSQVPTKAGPELSSSQDIQRVAAQEGTADEGSDDGMSLDVVEIEPIRDSPVFSDMDPILADGDEIFVPYDPTIDYGQARTRRRPRHTMWVRADYLNWWLEGADVPALVTTSPAGTDRNDAGVLGLPTTSLLFGGDELADDDRSGARIEVGQWLESCQGVGWHAAFFAIDDLEDRGRFDSGSTPIIARPFFSIEPSQVGPNAELVALPGELEGNLAIDASTSLEGAEFMLRWMLENSRDRRVEFIAGYQYAGLDDDLTIRDFKRVIGGSSGLAIGTTLAESDQFHTDNQFHGAALGILASARSCRTTLDVGMQMALGNNRTQVRIDGSTTSSVPNAGGGNDVSTTRGGLLALNSNIGVFEDDVFAVVPQLHVNLGYDLHPQVRAIVGYRFLYWSQVARAAEQIDSGVNLSQLDPAGLVGESRPRFDYQFSDFWAQGINVGLDYRF